MILVANPGLKNSEFYPVMGWERKSGCSVMIGFCLTGLPNARDPS